METSYLWPISCSLGNEEGIESDVGNKALENKPGGRA